MRPFLALSIAFCLCCLPACGDQKETPSGGEAGAPAGDAASAGVPPAIGGGVVSGTNAKVGLDAALRRRLAAASASGRTFLLAEQDAKGGFGDKEMKVPGNVAFTAMAVNGLVAATDATMVGADASLRKGLAFLVGFQQENGSIVDNPKWTNYCTSAAVSALAAAKVGDFRTAQAKASAYLSGSQIAEDPKNSSFGGFPYKAEQSADASNALMASNALDADGLPADSEVRKRVGAFVTKLQNRSESNTAEMVIEVDGQKRVVVSGDDGGGFYRPDESKAGMVKRSDGKWELRSYGSMTYAVLKLLLFAGIPGDDPRVEGVRRWIANNWTVSRNPGFEGAEDPEKMSQQGMFYFLYTATRALAAYEKSTGKPLIVKSADGREHNWRAEIAAELLGRQAQDGSWRNETAERWEEGSRTLCTGFALQTIGYLTGRFQ